MDKLSFTQSILKKLITEFSSLRTFISNSMNSLINYYQTNLQNSFQFKVNLFGMASLGIVLLSYILLRINNSVFRKLIDNVIANDKEDFKIGSLQFNKKQRDQFFQWIMTFFETIISFIIAFLAIYSIYILLPWDVPNKTLTWLIYFYVITILFYLYIKANVKLFGFLQLKKLSPKDLSFLPSHLQNEKVLTFLYSFTQSFIVFFNCYFLYIYLSYATSLIPLFTKVHLSQHIKGFLLLIFSVYALLILWKMAKWLYSLIIRLIQKHLPGFKQNPLNDNNTFLAITSLIKGVSILIYFSLFYKLLSYSTALLFGGLFQTARLLMLNILSVGIISYLVFSFYNWYTKAFLVLVEHVSEITVLLKNIPFRFLHLLLERIPVNNILKGIIKFIKDLITLIIGYFYLTIIFSFFHSTKSWSKWMFLNVRNPIINIFSSILNYLPNLFLILIISYVTYIVLKVVKFFFLEVEKQNLSLPNFYPEWAEPTYKVLRFIILAFMLVIIFPYLPGSSSPAFIGIAVFIGILFSLGATSSISNIFSGIVLTYMRPFKIGDQVQIAGTIGQVIEKTILFTRIHTNKNEEVTISNSIILNNHIINMNAKAEIQSPRKKVD
ncbi:MAG: hypothetical protein A2Y40_05950 [Candidatus Margulisbacteria bacterium GWF2_35_9]|nr:MAG: hypothetical protein A2Y40_05950 [Candidatus Margulisbacteria bacterium GWF2_35_9]